MGYYLGMDSGRWNNRIVSTGEMSVEDLHANPKNWRLHPRKQQEALAGTLGEVGVVQGVVFNQRTGRLVDGHLRVDLARRTGQESVPVTIVDLSEEEESLVLATLDPIGSMAAADLEKLEEILADVGDRGGGLGELLDSMRAPDELMFSGFTRGEEERRQEKYVTLMLSCAESSLVEQAIESALERGAGTRADAMVEICEGYLGETKKG